jgi:signal recognition particle receptor subunit beta
MSLGKSNLRGNELILKIAYCGPDKAGKITNINRLGEVFKDYGRMVTLLGGDGFTLYFEFLKPALKLKNGYTVKYIVFSSPGEKAPKLTHDLFAQGIDGIVFVVDSDASRLEYNRESLSNLLELLEKYKEENEKIQVPIIVQYNKRDLSTALPVEVLKKKLHLEKYPGIEAEAINGKGVTETFTKIAKESLKNFFRKSKLSFPD